MYLKGFRAVAFVFAASAFVGANASVFTAIEDADAVAGTHSSGFVYDTFNTGNRPWVLENWSEATDVIAHMKWDLSSMSPGSVTSATLRMFHDINNANGATFDIYRVLAPWSEATLTYATRPSLQAGWGSLTVGDNSTGVTRDWDVTALVQGWVNGTFANDGLAMTENTVGIWPYLRSRDHGSGPGPELIINGVPEPTTMAALGIGALALIRRRRSK